MKKITTSLLLCVSAFAIQAAHASVADSKAETMKKVTTEDVKKLNDEYDRYLVAQAEGIGIARKEKCSTSLNVGPRSDGEITAFIYMHCPRTSTFGYKSEHETLHKLYEERTPISDAIYKKRDLVSKKSKLEKLKDVLIKRGTFDAVDRAELGDYDSKTLEQIEKELKAVTAALQEMQNIQTNAYLERPYVDRDSFWATYYKLFEHLSKEKYHTIAKKLHEEDNAEQAALKKQQEAEAPVKK